MSELIEVNEKAIERLKSKIVIAENTNLRTKAKSEEQMVKDIKKWIEEEEKCCSNQSN
jgi:prophage tail gpP-like protein